MLEFTRLAWLWTNLPSLIGAILGVVLSYFLPGGNTREYKFRWRPLFAVAVGFAAGIYVGTKIQFWLLIPLTALLIAYIASRLPDLSANLRPAQTETTSTTSSGKTSPDSMNFRKDWNVRPRFEDEKEGLFVGRIEFLDRLTSHFISRGGGTILISGVRGVGKTALVDRALVKARQELQTRYWEATARYLNNIRPWHVLDLQVRRTLLRLAQSEAPTKGDSTNTHETALVRLERILSRIPRLFEVLMYGESAKVEPTNTKALRLGAEKYVKIPVRHWWTKLNPVCRRIHRMNEAARWQLFVLKFSASDISGALAEPGQKVTGKPRIDPEKLLRSLIRKLFITCHDSRQATEATILKWSLRDKRERQRFNEVLETAYNKSISKSYKEVISNRISELIKRSQSSTFEGKASLEKVLLVLACVILGVVGGVLGWARAWSPLALLFASGAPGLVAGYLVLSWTVKRLYEKSSDRANEAQTSYEYDYSLDQMQRDVESLVRILHPSDQVPHHPYRCLTRTVVIFDELDKLERADRQLDDVITHFKNFFTLSEAVFVFLTDHEFYEHLIRETVKAQLARHYPPQHTFFTEKFYLRKPEFLNFREALYQFTDTDWLVQRARAVPHDPMLIADLLQRKDQSLKILEDLPLETLTYLYIHSAEYLSEQKAAIDAEFVKQNGMSNPLAVAQIWDSLTFGEDKPAVLDDIKELFFSHKGWESPEAVAFLYSRKSDFSKDEEMIITNGYRSLGDPSIANYEGVDGPPFTLSDLARALCFQTRNHYFDLYNTVHDYVYSYNDGAPVMSLQNDRFAHEPRLWSRYQQLLEKAFDSARERHSSREYFNALLIESLYRVFDKRDTGESIKIGDVLFPNAADLSNNHDSVSEENEHAQQAATNGDDPETVDRALSRLLRLASDGLAAKQVATVTPEQAAAPPVRSFTDRDADKISRAIVFLLRLALAHRAIESDKPDFKERISDIKLKPRDLAELTFVWKDNPDPIIRSIEREPHETELVNFWRTHEKELAPLDIELGLLLQGLPTTGEGGRMRSAISELRSKAEGLALKSTNVSRPDANTLRLNVGTPGTWDGLLPKVALERIKAEEDADVVEDFEKPYPSLLKSGKEKFEAATRLRLRAIISPRDADCVFYFVASPIPADFKVAAFTPDVFPANMYLLWYVLGKETPAPLAIERTHRYSAPPNPSSANALVSEYVKVTKISRLARITSFLKTADDKDGTLTLRAGAEVLGHIVPGDDLGLALTKTPVLQAIPILCDLRERFSQTGMEAWASYKLGPFEEWSSAKAPGVLAGGVGKALSLDPEVIQVLEGAIADATQASRTKSTIESWTRSFSSATSDPDSLTLLALGVPIRKVMDLRIKDEQFDDKLKESIVDKFVPWLARAIVDLAKTRNITVPAFLQSPDGTAELEKRRRSLRLIPPDSSNVTATVQPANLE